jgi:hypothetical protein
MVFFGNRQGGLTHRKARKEGKQFFFEKKNQKTFVYCGGTVLAHLDYSLFADFTSFL